ncbi:phenylalanine--tRNA ligase subunit beta [Candidatus Microgenomates bacterium]|nr:phenylalanine--tRNA ligase subunit beta [Candidatus Microgenomates bacterium]
MDILIPDSWLREFLKTKATSKQIAEYLSLCGPSVEKVTKEGEDFVYLIEITTNRVDSASVLGIAREAAAVLPRFGILASFIPLTIKREQEFSSQVTYLTAHVDSTLCPRFTAVLIKNVKIAPSPAWMQKRLTLIGIRPINNIVDISNYLMAELGQPTHTFDYDKIRGATMKLRAAAKGEKITTLDGKTHTLPGGDIVIEDGEGRLIDLAGIMGGENSAVHEHTKNVLLFVQTYNPATIRRTSMSLAHRTVAATLFEKGLSTQLVSLTIKRGIDLFEELTGGQAEKEILDIYPHPYKENLIKTNLEFIQKRIGVEMSEKEISNILTSLGFAAKWINDTIEVVIPSWRAQDIGIPEDIVEEVARIYGYHNLPSELMTGKIPDPLPSAPFDFELKVKHILKGWGGVEVYTLSLTPGEFVDLEGRHSWALKLRNPLGSDSEYLRTSLAPSLASAAQQNAGEKEPFHLFEMANVYLPTRGKLPEEKMILGGIFIGHDYRTAKGIIEAFLAELNIEATFNAQDAGGFLPNHRISITSKKEEIGQLGVLTQNKFIHYEFNMELLHRSLTPQSFHPIPKYPAHVEDISLVLPPRTLLGGVFDAVKNADTHVVSVELIDVYQDTRTLRIKYQNPHKTLNDKEVEKIREKIIKMLRSKFGVHVK